MVDVSAKSATVRTAHALALIQLPESIFKLLERKTSSDGSSVDEIRGPKGPVFTTAIIAGVMAAKQTSNLIPFCHPLPIEYCDVAIKVDREKERTVRVDCIVRTTNKTGVEMEALVGASNAALCIYDMLKAISHDIEITSVKLLKKTGGKSDMHT
jgi:cyclic pyranopterin phosphate synthase